ncbi:hypothetical protein FMO003_18240 [Moritella sp. F3]|nr:hypothetical protein FMO001_07310 [Moritella sp. F1]GIC81543.1 hypothetical protein FMO003_18240 [Moritella sp. F3]
MLEQKQMLFSLLLVSFVFIGATGHKNTVNSGQHYLNTLSCASDKSGIEGYSGIKSCVLGR